MEASGVHESVGEEFDLPALIDTALFYRADVLPAFNVRPVLSENVPTLAQVGRRVRTLAAQILRECAVRDAGHVMHHFRGGRYVWLCDRMATLLNMSGVANINLQRFRHAHLKLHHSTIEDLAYDPDGELWLDKQDDIEFPKFDNAGNVTPDGQAAIIRHFAANFSPEMAEELAQLEAGAQGEAQTAEDRERVAFIRAALAQEVELIRQQETNAMHVQAQAEAQAQDEDGNDGIDELLGLMGQGDDASIASSDGGEGGGNGGEGGGNGGEGGGNGGEGGGNGGEGGGEEEEAGGGEDLVAQPAMQGLALAGAAQEPDALGPELPPFNSTEWWIAMNAHIGARHAEDPLLNDGVALQVLEASNPNLPRSRKWWGSAGRIRTFMRLLEISVPRTTKTKAALATLLAIDQEFGDITETGNEGFGAEGNLNQEPQPPANEGPDYDPNNEDEEDEEDV